MENIPTELRDKLQQKLTQNALDINEVIALALDDNQCGNEKNCLVALAPMASHENIHLLDHMISFEQSQDLHEALKNNVQLRERIDNILGHSVPCEDLSMRVQVGRQMKMLWPYVGRNLISNTFHILDEIGNRMLHSHNCSKCSCTDKSSGCGAAWSCADVEWEGTSYTAVWPRRSVLEDEVITCSGLSVGRGKLHHLLHALEWAENSSRFSTSCNDGGGNDNDDNDNDNDDDTSADHTNDNEPQSHPLAHCLQSCSCWESPACLCHAQVPQSAESSSTVTAAAADDSTTSGEVCVMSVCMRAAACLATTLRRHEYSVSRISALLKLTEIGACLPVWLLSHGALRDRMLTSLEDCKEPLWVLIKLFLLGVPVGSAELTDCFSQSDCLIPLLHRLHILAPYGQIEGIGDQGDCLWISVVQLTPVQTPTMSSSTTASQCGDDLFVMTDFTQTAEHLGFDPVMYVGPDSLGLIHSVVTAASSDHHRFARALDLCAGGGVQGLMTLFTGLAEHVTLVEINPRAVRFAAFNAMLNNLQDRVSIKLGDVKDLSTLLTSTSSQHLKFDIILANPPYIPSVTPNRDTARLAPSDEKNNSCSLPKYGDGGNNGEDITQAILSNIWPFVHQRDATMTTKTTAVCIVGNLVNVEDYPSKIVSWITRSDQDKDGNEESEDDEDVEEDVEEEETQGDKQAAGTDMHIHNDNDIRLVSGVVCHGVKWSPEEYASLILPAQDTDEEEEEEEEETDASSNSTGLSRAAGHYAVMLRQDGVTDVVNGLIFLQCQQYQLPSNLHRDQVSASANVSVLQCEEQLWQVLALKQTRSELQQRAIAQTLQLHHLPTPPRVQYV